MTREVVVERWDGREREVVEHPGSVAIVAFDRDGLALTRQFREGAGRGCSNCRPGSSTSAKTIGGRAA